MVKMLKTIWKSIGVVVTFIGLMYTVISILIFFGPDEADEFLDKLEK